MPLIKLITDTNNSWVPTTCWKSIRLILAEVLHIYASTFKQCVNWASQSRSFHLYLSQDLKDCLIYRYKDIQVSMSCIKKYYLHYLSSVKVLFTSGGLLQLYNTVVYQRSSLCHKLYSLGLCLIIHCCPDSTKVAKHFSWLFFKFLSALG